MSRLSPIGSSAGQFVVTWSPAPHDDSVVFDVCFRDDNTGDDIKVFHTADEADAIAVCRKLNAAINRRYDTSVDVPCNKPEGYDLIRLWHESSYPQYIAILQRSAYATRAPRDALYWDGVTEHRWITLRELSPAHPFRDKVAEQGLNALLLARYASASGDGCPG